MAEHGNDSRVAVLVDCDNTTPEVLRCERTADDEMRGQRFVSHMLRSCSREQHMKH